MCAFSLSQNEKGKIFLLSALAPLLQKLALNNDCHILAAILFLVFMCGFYFHLEFGGNNKI